jgi:hypothetical protein
VSVGHAVADADDRQPSFLCFGVQILDADRHSFHRVNALDRRAVIDDPPA